MKEQVDLAVQTKNNTIEMLPYDTVGEQTRDSAQELLQFALANGMIDLTHMQQMAEMKKREELLSQHQNKIWQGSDKKWYTYLYDEDGNRTLKKRATKKSLDDLLIKHYKAKEDDPTVKDVFYAWLSKKLQYKEIQKGSADRYETDFVRFFDEAGAKFVGKSGTRDTKFGGKSVTSTTKIRTVTQADLEDFIRTQIADNNLTAKGYSGLRIVVRGIWGYASKRGWTNISISEFFGDLEISRNTFRRNVKEQEDEVFSEDEVPVIVQYLKDNPTIWNLGILLVLQTGLRVGELSALKPEDWQGGNILKIRRTEVRYKNDQGKNVVDVRNFTKTSAGMRDVILSDGGIETLRKIQELNPDGEYMFEGKTGNRIRGNTFNKRMDIVLRQLGLHHRSIHKGRKTYGTMLIDAGCEDSLVMNQLGHTSIETSRKYYYFSNLTKSHKIQQIKNAVHI